MPSFQWWTVYSPLARVPWTDELRFSTPWGHTKGDDFKVVVLLDAWGYSPRPSSKAVPLECYTTRRYSTAAFSYRSTDLFRICWLILWTRSYSREASTSSQVHRAGYWSHTLSSEPAYSPLARVPWTHELRWFNAMPRLTYHVNGCLANGHQTGCRSQELQC